MSALSIVWKKQRKIYQVHFNDRQKAAVRRSLFHQQSCVLFLARCDERFFRSKVKLKLTRLVAKPEESKVMQIPKNPVKRLEDEQRKPSCKLIAKAKTESNRIKLEETKLQRARRSLLWISTRCNESRRSWGKRMQGWAKSCRVYWETSTVRGRVHIIEMEDKRVCGESKKNCNLLKLRLSCMRDNLPVILEHYEQAKGTDIL